VAVAPWFTDQVVPLSLIASARTNPVAEDLVGYLLNPLMVQVVATSDATLDDLARHAATAVGTALPFRDHPIAKIVTAARSEGITLADSRILVSVDEEATARLDDAVVTHHAMFNGDAVGDLSFFVEVRTDVIELGLEYRGSSVGRSTAEQVLARWGDAFHAVVHAPNTAAGTIVTPAALVSPIAPASATEEASVAPNQRPAPAVVSAVAAASAPDAPALDSPGDVPEVSDRPAILVGPELTDSRMVASQIRVGMETRPEAPAVTCGDTTITWAELDQRSAAVAATLVAQGVDRGDRVIVALPRSVDCPLTRPTRPIDSP